MCRSILVLCLLTTGIALVFGQDAFTFPTQLLADFNPGTASSVPHHLTHIERAGKAYGVLQFPDQMFIRFFVTNGTKEGTRMLEPFNTTTRGSPSGDPLWAGYGTDNVHELTQFDDKVWFIVYNYDIERLVLWSIDSRDDILREHRDATRNDVLTHRAISSAIIFKGDYYVLNGEFIKFDQEFTQYTRINKPSDFDMTITNEATFTGFEYVILFLKTDDLLLLLGTMQSVYGLWAFNGTTVRPINYDEGISNYRLPFHDALNNKYYYSGQFKNFNFQLFLFDPSDLSQNYTVLTNYSHCNYDGCAKDIGLMNNEKGSIWFIYDTLLGFSNGTIEGTMLFERKPVGRVLGVHFGRIYFQEYQKPYIYYTSGIKGDIVPVTEQTPSLFFDFEGDILFLQNMDFARLSITNEVTIIRSHLSLEGRWTTITLPNNNTQVYLYNSFSVENTNSTLNKFWLYVSNGQGIVRYSAAFNEKYVPAIYLSNRFILSSYSVEAGHELFYMDPAIESYDTPASPQSVITSSARGTSYFIRFVIVVLSLSQWFL